MSDKLNIEELAKNKLSNYKPAVPANAWAGVEAQLGVTKAAAASVSSIGFVNGALVGVALSLAVVGGMNLTPYGGNAISKVEKATETNTAVTEEPVTDEVLDLLTNDEQVGRQLSENEPTEFSSSIQESSSVELAKENVSFEEFVQEKAIDVAASSGLSNQNEIQEEVVQDGFSSTIIASPVAGNAPLEITFNVKDVSKARWNLGDGSPLVDDINFSHVFEESGSYEVTLIAQHTSGKIYQDRITVQVTENEDSIVADDEPLDIRIPNVFTPNADGVNDVFEVELSQEVSSFYIGVYNSAGRLVFESTQPSFEWNGTERDGTDSPSGTYFYQIKAVGVNNNVYAPKGSLTITR